MNRPNASYSRNYLTCHNYRGPNLLRTIRRIEVDAQPVEASLKMSAGAATQIVESDRNHDNNYVCAPPESEPSGDERDKSPRETAVIPSKARKSRQTKVASSPMKQSADTAASQRSKRRKLKDERSLDTSQIPEDPTSNDLFGIPSSSSQKKRHNKVYGKKFQVPPPLEEQSKSRTSREGFKAPEGLDLSPKTASKTKLVQPDNMPELDSQRGKRRTIQTLVLPQSPEQTRGKHQKSDFRGPDAPEVSSSGGTENRSIRDGFDSPEGSARKRSGSTSSLSSVDDMLILANEDDYKAEPELTSFDKLCPVCEQPVHDSSTLFVPDNLHTLPFQQQQNFCTQHKIAEAKEEWKRRGYPRIDWDEVKSFRIPEKLPRLEAVVRREVPSFYRDQLDAKIRVTKGHQKELWNYLNEGLADIAKSGYYGPKGAHIMVNSITASLTEAFKFASTCDATFFRAGVGAYVSAVLVPELTLRLVMDDMHLKTAEEGRKVLDESTAVGEWLNPDDDSIERQDTDEG